MEFCKSCGGILNLFETNEEKLCRSCEKKVAPPIPAGEKTVPETAGDLDNAILVMEKESLVLKAEEGWTLWSGPAAQPVRLKDILKRARKIHQIRSKRNRPKN